MPNQIMKLFTKEKKVSSGIPNDGISIRMTMKRILKSI